MRKRCCIQQGEKITVHQSKVLNKLLFRFLGGPPTNEKLMANPENDSPLEITHKIKSFQPNLMILVYNEEKMFYPARWKKITVDQSKVLKIDCSVLFGPPGIVIHYSPLLGGLFKLKNATTLAIAWLIRTSKRLTHRHFSKRSEAIAAASPVYCGTLPIALPVAPW